MDDGIDDYGPTYCVHERDIDHDKCTERCACGHTCNQHYMGGNPPHPCEHQSEESSCDCADFTEPG